MSKKSETMTLKELVQLLECPVCLQVKALSSYIQCMNGHFCCKKCFSRVSNCPICREHLVFKAKTFARKTWMAFKKELRHVEDFESRVNLKCLLDLLKCNNCHFKPTRRPIWQCRNGHLICDECFFKVKPFCVICQIFFPSLRNRNLIAEAFLSFYDKPCRFTQYGCNVMIKCLSDHEKEDCIYREVNCVFKRCKEKVTIAKLKGHLEENNKNHNSLKAPLELNLLKVQNKMVDYLNLSIDSDGKIYLKKDWNKVSFMKLENIHSFIPVCWVSSYYRICVFWVYYLGLPKEVKNFAFRLRLFDLQCSNEIDVTRPVMPLYTSYNYMFTQKSTFKIKFSEIENTWGQAGIKLKWDVSVFQK